MPRSYSGRQRAGSISSIRSRKRPPASPAEREIEERRIGVAEMELAIRARREAEDGMHGGARSCGLSGRPVHVHALAARSGAANGRRCAPSRAKRISREGLAYLAKRDRRLRKVIEGRRRGAAPPASERLRRAGAHRRRPAGLDRQRRGDLGPLRRGVPGIARPTPSTARARRRLRAPGLSAPKIRTLRAVAAACRDGLDLDALADDAGRGGACAASPRSRASARGRPTSISSSASATPTSSRPATSRSATPSPTRFGHEPPLPIDELAAIADTLVAVARRRGARCSGPTTARRRQTRRGARLNARRTAHPRRRVARPTRLSSSSTAMAPTATTSSTSAASGRRVLPGTAFASPHAPEPCDERAERAPVVPAGHRLRPALPRPRLPVAPRRSTRFLDAELARYGLADDRLALVGFSQGTMMALHVGPRRSEPIAGIVGYSGLLLGPGAHRRREAPHAADPARPWRCRRDDPGDRAASGGARRSARPASRSNGTSAPASATASIRRGWSSAPPSSPASSARVGRVLVLDFTRVLG